MGCLDHVRDLVVLVIQLLQHLLAGEIQSRTALSKHLRAALDHLLDWLVRILRLEGVLQVAGVGVHGVEAVPGVLQLLIATKIW